MNEIDFLNWMEKQPLSRKTVSDTRSRLKRIEQAMANCDLDYEYSIDRCASLLLLFRNQGENPLMKSRCMDTSFPIKKYDIYTYKYSLKWYIKFKDYQEIH